MWTYSNELYHHGVKGQRWGFRRYQNKDGTLTKAGRKRANKLVSQYNQLTGGKAVPKKNIPSSAHETPTKVVTTSKKKSVHEMSDDELNKAINRLQMEQRYNQLQPMHVSKGKKFIDKIVAPAATDASKQLLKEWLVKQGKDVLKLANDANNQKKKK